MEASNSKLGNKMKNMQDNLDNLKAVLTSRDKELNCLNGKLDDYGQYMFKHICLLHFLFYFLVYLKNKNKNLKHNT